jgi:hypothetical protein
MVWRFIMRKRLRPLDNLTAEAFSQLVHLMGGYPHPAGTLGHRKTLKVVEHRNKWIRGARALNILRYNTIALLITLVRMLPLILGRLPTAGVPWLTCAGWSATWCSAGSRRPGAWRCPRLPNVPNLV